MSILFKYYPAVNESGQYPRCRVEGLGLHFGYKTLNPKPYWYTARSVGWGFKVQGPDFRLEDPEPCRYIV